MRAPDVKGRTLIAQLMLLDLGKVTEALELEGRLKAAAAAGSNPLLSKGSKGGDSEAESAAAQDSELARKEAQARVEAVLRAIELDCVAVGGPDVGCGLSALGGVGRYRCVVKRRDVVVFVPRWLLYEATRSYECTFSSPPFFSIV